MNPTTEEIDGLKRQISDDERQKLPLSDFVDPDNRAFFIAEPKDVDNAVHSFGRGDVSFDKFKARLIEIAKRKGAAFVAQLPQEWKDDMKKALTQELSIVEQALKAGRVLSGTNAEKIGAAVQRLIEVLASAGIDLSGVQPQAAPDEPQAAATPPAPASPVPAKALDDLLVYSSQPQAIKALGDNRYGMYAAIWGSPSQKDLQKQWFDKDTDFCLDWYSTRPQLYHHGLDGKIQTTKAGTIDTARKDDIGLWIEFQLNQANAYKDAIQQLIGKGVIGGSSAAPPHLVDIEDSGYIKRWPFMENSLTVSPVDPRQVGRVVSLKSFLAALDVTAVVKESAAEEAPAKEPAPAPKALSKSPSSRKSTLRSMKDMNIPDLIAVLEANNIKSDAILAIIKDPKLSPGATDDTSDADDPNSPDAQAADANGAGMMAVTPKAKAGVAAKVNGKSVEVIIQETVDAKVADALKAKFGDPEPRSAVDPVAGGKGVNQVRDLHRKYEQLDTPDLVYLAHSMAAMAKKGIDGAVMPSPQMLRATFERLQSDLKSDNRKVNIWGVKAFQLKAMINGMKADEAEASNLANQGQNWVGTAYSDQLWYKAREAPIYQAIEAKGMMQVTIAQGMNNMYIPTEGTDPTWYSLQELNDETSDERLPVTAKSSAPTPGRQQVTLGMIGARVWWTDILDEDSLIPIAAFNRFTMEKSFAEQFEYALLNGDTATAGSTNINLIDGTPAVDAKGRGPVYLACNGPLKLALVTTTTLSRDGGVMDEDDYMSTFALLPTPQQNEDDCLFVVTRPVYNSSRKLAALKTVDVAGTNATLQGGKITQMFGIDLLSSGQMPLANTSGKISATAGNNTLGRILCIRPDQWVLGHKRDVRTEVARDIDAQATVMVSTMRFGFASRGVTGGAAVSYDLTLN